MNRELVFFTLEYPDPLSNNEIKGLAKEFSKVYVLPQKRVSEQGVSDLPQNVEVVDLFKDISLNKIWTRLHIHIPLILRLSSWALFRSGYAKYYTKYFKSFLGYLFIEAEKIAPLEQFVREHKLEKAIFYDYWLVDSTLALAELKRKRIIQYSIARAHGFDLYHERHHEKIVPYREYRISYLDAVFTISQHGFNYLTKQLPPVEAKKIKLSYLGTSVLSAKTLPQKKEAGYTIVSCSSLISLKRVELIIDALIFTTLTIRWIHFGDGPLKNSLEEKASALPKNVSTKFKGNIANDQLLEFYQSTYIDLFISLSESEGLPVSMMEAGSYGIPIFACGVNGVPEIVSEETGVILTKEIEPQAVCEILERTLLNKKFNRERIREFCQQKFNAEKNFKLFINEIKQLSA
jgi:glycosyltransferase involved in cell wall biosynthesis